MTIASILNTLQVYDGHWPNFSSSILFELYYQNSSQEYILKVILTRDRAQNEVNETWFTDFPDLLQKLNGWGNDFIWASEMSQPMYTSEF